MDITYFRSSSYNCWEGCQHDFFLRYNLGLQTETHPKAILGTTVHKVMEGLALSKLALQNGQNQVNEKVLGSFYIDKPKLESDTFLDWLIGKSIHYFLSPEFSSNIFADSDKALIYKWSYEAVTFNGGIMDPRKKKIVSPEGAFDFEIKQPWALLANLGGKPKYLRLKGTIDLITDAGDGIYEVIDWKTGARKDWATQKEKDFTYLCNDAQLRIYHLACTLKYPEIKKFAFTINFIRDGGPFTVVFDESDLEVTLRMLERRYNTIRQCTRPSLKSRNRGHFFCTRVCQFYKTPHKKDPSKDVCRYIHDLVLSKGIQYVVDNERAEGFSVDYYENPGE